MLDKVWSLKSKSINDVMMSFNLNFDVNFMNNNNQIILDKSKTRITFLGSDLVDFQISEKLNSKQEYYENNISMYYNSLKKTTKLNISAKNHSEIYFLTFIEFGENDLKNYHKSFKEILDKEEISLDKIDKYLDNITNLGVVSEE